LHTYNCDSDNNACVSSGATSSHDSCSEHNSEMFFHLPFRSSVLFLKLYFSLAALE
jgi:hypothetical protein